MATFTIFKYTLGTHNSASMLLLLMALHGLLTFDLVACAPTDNDQADFARAGGRNDGRGSNGYRNNTMPPELTALAVFYILFKIMLLTIPCISLCVCWFCFYNKVSKVT